jgi:hypothetical protein
MLSNNPVSLDSLANIIIPNPQNVGFENLSTYDFNLKSTSVAINKGRNPGYAGTFSLKPDKQYLHPENFNLRTTVDSIDVGAYEYGFSTYSSEKKYSTDFTFYNDSMDKKITVKINDITASAQIYIYDISGRVVCNKIVHDRSFEWQYNNFSKGTYIFKIVANNREYTRKFQVN